MNGGGVRNISLITWAPPYDKMRTGLDVSKRIKDEEAIADKERAELNWFDECT